MAWLGTSGPRSRSGSVRTPTTSSRRRAPTCRADMPSPTPRSSLIGGRSRSVRSESPPFLVDHSAFDAYALLVEADDKRVYYSGDFRAHGRKAALFERMIERPPKDIDVLLMEGTTIGRAGTSEGFATEADLEREFVRGVQGNGGHPLRMDLVAEHRSARDHLPRRQAGRPPARHRPLHRCRPRSDGEGHHSAVRLGRHSALCPVPPAGVYQGERAI